MDFFETESKFNITEYINELAKDEEKREIIKKYKKYVQKNIKEIKSVEELKTYKNYLQFFDTTGISVKLPSLFVSLDIDFLLKLVASSFSSSYYFEYDKEEGIHRLRIDVSSGDKSVKKYLDELWEPQIDRMYEIYMEEQLNLEIIANEDKKEKDIIISQRKLCIDKFYQKKEQYFAEHMYGILTKDI